MIKVLHVIVGLNVGGAELMLQRLINNSSDNVEHMVVSLTTKGRIGEELSARGIVVRSLGLKGLLTLPGCFFNLLRIVASIKPDVVHTWMYHADFLGGLAAFLVGRRNVVWCVRSTNIELAGNKATVLLRRVCAFFSHIIPRKIIYAAEASRLAHERLGYCEKKSLVVPNGFLVNDFLGNEHCRDEVRSELSIEEGDILIGTVGRYHPVKDHATMIAALSALVKTRQNLRLVMVGRGLDSSNMELLALLEQWGVTDQCILLGQRSDVARLMSGFDIFCLHSISEGFPNVLGEAMLSGLPCVVTDVGDASFLLDDARFVSKSRDVGELVENMLLMFSLSGHERKNIAIRNRDRILNGFSIESVVSVYREIYQNIGSDRS
ncbi:glycosyltransferase family 4 protein [Alcanivorax sediminis]|uniref:Glycosyltransferase n=1 Tax=Alcanivorax sediminis TaxID=2663008 RepID=A0A6N7LVI5_9GAMM|nr:glycosyltransferase [Alcanivorax sediminis]MQX54382.1 glycosyltransferase [Alcanivorax sediminis]